MPLTSIALIDVTTKTKTCLIVDKTGEIKETNQNNTHIIPCGSEKELIKRFLDRLEELDPTIIAGWNSAYFDIPYLDRKSTRLNSSHIPLSRMPSSA